MAANRDALMRTASRAYGEGRLPDAERLAREILASHPKDAEATLLAGVIATKSGRHAEAVELLMPLVEWAPGSAQAHHWLSTALRRGGDPRRALQIANRGLEAHRTDPQLLHQVGACHIDLKEWEAAVPWLEAAAKLDPKAATIGYNLGFVYEALWRSDDARREYERTLTLNPNHLFTLHQIGQILAAEGDFRGATDYADRIVRLAPDSCEGHVLRAVGLVGNNNAQGAAEHAEKALELQPDKPEVLTMYGTILQSLGRLADSEPYLRRSLELDPLQGYAYFALVRIRKLREADRPLIEKMEQAVRDPRLSQRPASHIEYALGKAYTDLGEYEKAMADYDEANRIIYTHKFGAQEFDRATFAAAGDFAMRSLTRPRTAADVSLGRPDRLPIMVVGMMRSGTTLVEQILSSHPEVGGAGEQRFWMDNRTVAMDSSGRIAHPARLKDLAGNYIELLQEIAPGKTKVVDKLPGNSMHLGLIHLALPNAAIIHVRRNPVDTCLSIWITPNARPNPWSTNKSNLVFVYREYLRTMEHWRRVLAPDRLLEVDYEELVADQEAVTRRMVEFCGLDWDERCLHPEENIRAVATPSDWQVRQPVYRSAVDRWRLFEPWLGELRELISEG